MNLLEKLVESYHVIKKKITIRRSIRKMMRAADIAAGGGVKRLRRAFRKAGKDLSTNAAAAAGMLSAASVGNYEAVEFFLKHNVPTNASSAFFRRTETAESLALQINDEKIIDLLKKHRSAQYRQYLDNSKKSIDSTG